MILWLTFTIINRQGQPRCDNMALILPAYVQFSLTIQRVDSAILVAPLIPSGLSLHISYPTASQESDLPQPLRRYDWS